MYKIRIIHNYLFCKLNMQNLKHIKYERLLKVHNMYVRTEKVSSKTSIWMGYIR